MSSKNLDDRSRRVVFIGYEVGTKAYRFFDPVSKKVIISRDVIFEEEVKWNWDCAETSENRMYPRTTGFFKIEGIPKETEAESVQTHSSDQLLQPFEQGADSYTEDAAEVQMKDRTPVQFSLKNLDMDTPVQ